MGSENLEFRIVQAPDKDNSIEVYDQDKTPHFVCNTPSLDKNDIEDIYVDLDHPSRNKPADYRVTIYFKKSSWSKVREFS